MITERRREKEDYERSPYVTGRERGNHGEDVRRRGEKREEGSR